MLPGDSQRQAENGREKNEEKRRPTDEQARTETEKCSRALSVLV